MYYCMIVCGMSVFLSVHVGMSVSLGVCVRVRLQMLQCILDDRFSACKGTIGLKDGESIARRVYEHLFEYGCGMGRMREYLSCLYGFFQMRACVPPCVCVHECMR